MPSSIPPAPNRFVGTLIVAIVVAVAGAITAISGLSQLDQYQPVPGAGTLALVGGLFLVVAANVLLLLRWFLKNR